MNSGKYRYRAELWANPVRSDFGGRDDRPVKLRHLWIELTPRAAGEQNSAEMMESLARFEIRTPWTPDLLNSSMEIRLGKRVFEIDGVTNVGEMNFEWVLTVTEQRNGKDA